LAAEELVSVEVFVEVGCVAICPAVVEIDADADAMVGAGVVVGIVVVVPFTEVTIAATPAVAVMRGSAMENRFDDSLLQQSSAEQQYLDEFLPHRITHSPPFTLSMCFVCQYWVFALNSVLAWAQSLPATQFSGHSGEDHVLSVQVPRMNCSSLPVDPSHHPAGMQRELEVQRKPAVQHTLASAVLLHGTSFDIVPSGV
jgi:hypothetical protein